MKTKLTKFVSEKALTIDEENHTIDFIISTEDRDRHGDIVIQNGWDTENYEKNPTVLFGHDSWSFPIGKSLAIVYDEAKKRTVATIKFAVEEYEKAATAFALCAGGYLNTTSVGFINKESEGNELQKNELLEISIVPVPANPNAIALAFDAGEISKSDAQWLMKSFQTSIKSLEGSINKKKEGNQMTEAQEKMLTETVEKVSKMNDTIEVLSQNLTKAVDGIADMKKSFKAKDATDDTDPKDAPATDPEEDPKDPVEDPVTDPADPKDAKSSTDDSASDDTEDVLDSEVDPENMTDDQAKAFSKAMEDLQTKETKE